MTLSGTVLLVDDDPETVHAYSELLSREDGLRVLTARNGSEGFDAARIHRPDLILSDLVMDGEDGLALCRRVRAEASLEGTLFVLLTGHSTAFSEADAAAGVDDVISKPATAEELIAKVSAMLRLKRVYDQLRADKFQLQQQTGRRLAAPGGQALGDHPADPAAGVVFEAEDGIGDAAVPRAVVDAADAVEAALAIGVAGARFLVGRDAVDRPLPGRLDLLAQIARQPVGGADRAVRPR